MSRERELLERALNFFEEICDSRSVGIEKSINAYLEQPEVKREALSDEYLKIHIWQKSLDYGLGFVAGVRFAEKHHGIGGGE